MFACKSYGDCTGPIVGKPHSHRGMRSPVGARLARDER
jgi:hypothetical protein